MHRDQGPGEENSPSSVSRGIAQTWDDYASSSSVHGLRFTSAGFTIPRRVIWCFLLVAFFSVLVGFFASTVAEYFRFEVNTIVTMVSERRVNFPAVTICNLNTLRRSKFQAARKDPKYSKILNLAKILSLADIHDSGGNMSVPFLTGDRIRDMYQYFGHTMYRFEKGGMLLNCTYSQGDCGPTYFRPVLTDLGLCYTFNPGPKYLVGDGRQQQALTVTQPGNGFGLSLRLDAQTRDYILMPTHRFSAGWKVFVHDQNELPLAKDYGFAVSPGTHTLVGLEKRKVINLEPPYTTACRHAPLETGDVYSRRACLRICLEKYIYGKCGCYPAINFMNANESQLCDLESSIKCYLPTLYEFRKHGNNCVCPDACESVEYTPSLSYAYFPSDIYAVEIANHLVKAGIAHSNRSAMEYFKKNIIELDIFFQQMNHVVIKQVPSKTLRDIYSELGGLLGASLGASFLTFLELVDFIRAKIDLWLQKRRKRKPIKVKPIRLEIRSVGQDHQ